MPTPTPNPMDALCGWHRKTAGHIDEDAGYGEVATYSTIGWGFILKGSLENTHLGGRAP